MNWGFWAVSMTSSGVSQYNNWIKERFVHLKRCHSLGRFTPGCSLNYYCNRNVVRNFHSNSVGPTTKHQTPTSRKLHAFSIAWRNLFKVLFSCLASLFWLLRLIELLLDWQFGGVCFDTEVLVSPYCWFRGQPIDALAIEIEIVEMPIPLFSFLLLLVFFHCAMTKQSSAHL